MASANSPRSLNLDAPAARNMVPKAKRISSPREVSSGGSRSSVAAISLRRAELSHDRKSGRSDDHHEQRREDEQHHRQEQLHRQFGRLLPGHLAPDQTHA